MPTEDLEVLSVERKFFGALTLNPKSLDQLLADDCLMIDVLSGSEVPKSALLDVLKAGDLRFEHVEPRDSRVRIYGDTAIVTGSTRMRGRFHNDQFAVSSRYTHVYVKTLDEWQMVSAQGTQIRE
ncbi:MAG TPA: nuclear transport factor 2 family protein [Pyrinomonadaceae bacterium]|nr:nuclear transport factor 2 family protein [Pyrinomonadaceae bacterium]